MSLFFTIGLAFLLHALAGDGDCVNFQFPLTKAGDVDWPKPVKVISNYTPIYRSLSSSDKAEKSLEFNDNVYVSKAEDTRLLVHPVYTDTPIGWVDRSALLCTFKPLKGESGLEQKLYIKTAPTIRGGKPTTVKAYPTPDRKKCDGGCRDLSRFMGYFVVDYNEREKSYLLSDSYLLNESSKMVGWIDEDDAIIWNTSYGLRPKEDLTFEDSQGKLHEGSICAYEKIEDAINDSHCIPIPNGYRWFKSSFRIPLLKSFQKSGVSMYEVLLLVSFSSENKTKFIMPTEYEHETEDSDRTGATSITLIT